MLSAHTISIGPIAGGTGGAGGAAVDQGGTGGVGQGPSFIINTQSAIFNGNSYSAISSAGFVEFYVWPRSN
ncbi:hypothetical protein HMN09_00849200 [Mycena chlorophos]|uniref:Uncharacterized protein n=1 Tax=Mycena chlorophos TaxID=658473 RepID=A0A8H6W3N5_MYCCL|nr:hypothetical protein HMN09_00849200 [Mycena chlorophos]